MGARAPEPESEQDMSMTEPVGGAPTNPTPGQPGQQTAPPAGSLLADEAAQQGATPPGDGGQPGQPPGAATPPPPPGQPTPGQPGQAPDISAIVAQAVSAAVAQAEQRFQSEVDRRVTQVVQRFTGQQGAAPPAPPAPPAGGDGGGQQVQPPAPAAPVVPQVNVREARSVGRETLSDALGNFLGPDERALATSLLAAEIGQRISSGETDEDRIGQQAAQAVAEQIQKVRAMYETSTVAALRRRGALVDQPGQAPGGGPSGPSTPQTMSRGAQRAAAIRPGAAQAPGQQS